MWAPRNLIGSPIFQPGSPRNRSKATKPSPSCGWGLGTRLRPSPFIAEFAHTQLHSARARENNGRLHKRGRPGFREASRNHAFSRGEGTTPSLEEKAWCTAYTPLVPEECFVA